MQELGYLYRPKRGRDFLQKEGVILVSHPDPEEPPDRTPIQIAEVWENPISRERATVLELPHQNPERRAVAELLALVGAPVLGEHRHPGIVERFTALDGELVVKRDGLTRHDWWNATPACVSKSRPVSASPT